jgi:adenylate cyclase class IV
MVKVEVEHRGLLTEKKFTKLNKFLKKNGKFLGEKDRFSVIYSPRGKETLRVIRSPIDLKIRITNKKTELVLKYGRWSGNDARKEFLFPIDSRKFEEMTEFLMILGYYYGVLQATKTYCYLYKGIDFAIVKVPGWGYYFEAEIATNPESIKKANEKIILVCKEFGLNVLGDKDFCNLCKNLNDRPGFRFNFKKQSFSDIKKRFIDYF